MTERIPRIGRSEQWRAQFIEAHGFRCHYCNRPGGSRIGPDQRAWHVDHKDALAEGGADVEENLVLACKRCNLAKHTQPYDWFRAYAYVAFWSAPLEAPTDEELGDLLDSWVGTDQGTWSYQVGDRDTQAPHRVWCRPTDELSNSADDLVAEIPYGSGRSPGGQSIAEFLVRAHHIVPRLIAEVRMLRAERAETDEAGQPQSDLGTPAA